MKTRRRILALCLTLCMLVGLSPVYALEAPVSGTYGTNITWTLDTDGTLTISGKGDMGDDNDYPPWFDYRNDIKTVVISDGVTSIGYRAFYFCEALTNITIPDSVTSIGDYAFVHCASLASVTIPDGVTSIGIDAFSHCYCLASITLPDSVTSIGDYAFCNCGSLASITIPNSVARIGSHAFSGCTAFTSLVIPDSVTSVGAGIFIDCSKLETVTVDEGNPAFCAEDGVLFSKDKTVLYCYSDGKKSPEYAVPNTVRIIADDAFWGCDRLTSVTLSDGVTSIGEHAFWHCGSLVNITIPDSVTSIGDSAFWGCESLASVRIPNGVTSIGYGVFESCRSLASITIPDSVTSIDDFAFCGCDSLTSIAIPDSVTSIGEVGFSACSSLETIVVNKKNPVFCAEDGVLFSKDKTVLYCYPSGKNASSYTIPNTVRTIGNGAFNRTRNLVSITIPDGVTSIDSVAFSGCNSIVNITIPNGVTNIGWSAFSDCSALESITIPATVKKIEDSAFDGCSALKEVYFSGTKAQWNAMAIGIGIDSAMIHCSDGSVNGSDLAQLDVPVVIRTIWYDNNVVATLTTFAGGGMMVDATVPAGITAEIEIPMENIAMGSIATIVNEDGTEEIIQNSVPGEYRFTFFLDKSAKVKIVNNAKAFSDVTEKNWFKKAVDFVSARGIMGGVGNNLFDHKSTTTRAMVWTMLARLRGVDTSGGATWYEKGTNWVVENNLADGLNATDVIPREELAVLLWKLCGSPDADTAILDKFSDNAKISASAREAVAWAVQTGVMGGNADGTMDPTGGATRAHVAQIIMNYMTKI